MSAHTTPVAIPDQADRICPKCQTPNEQAALEQRQYRCAGCGLELAHLDMAANGSVRGVFGWVLQRGTLVGERYRIVSVLGKGGFGVTYLADDIRLAGKRRALKEIPELLFDEYETSLLGRLNHPAIPDIIDRFDVDGMVYLVLEFGGSRTLRIELERQGGRIPVFLLLPWIEQVCAALVYLHSQDPPIIHRDLKPENILLDDNERVMLIDFGIAKETAGDKVTRTLGRAVTHGFSPPEQVLGTGTDPRSDVYALGAILYWAITGRVPPAAHERITGTVLEPPSRIFPEIPPLLEAAICQALELNLHKRQQSVAELAHCLTLVHSGGSSARTVVGTDPNALMAGLSTTQGARLASLELPSTRQAPGPATVPSGNEQPLPEPAPAARPRVWGWAWMGLACVTLAGGGGWLYWRTGGQDFPRESPSNVEAPLIAAPAQTGAPASAAPPSAVEPASAIPQPGSTSSSATAADLANLAADAREVGGPLAAVPLVQATAPMPPPPEPIQAQVGHLQISVNIAAQVQLDGRSAGNAAPRQPLNLSDLDVGEHRLKVSAQGYAAQEKATRVEPGRWTQEIVTLVPERTPEPARMPVPKSTGAGGGDKSGGDRDIPSPSFHCGGRLQPVESVICNDAELAKVDGVMGGIYKDLRATLGGADADALRAAQRAWIKRRDRLCPVTAANRDSVPQRAHAVECLRRVTSERIAELQALLESVSRR